MLKLRRVDIERSEEVVERPNLYVGEIIAELNPYTIILFGSFAKNDINEGSDVDTLVVADFKENFLDRIKVPLDLNRFKVPVEPLGYTPEEFEDMKRRENPFIDEVTRTGKTLYQRQA